jgi:hypothetical protein
MRGSRRWQSAVEHRLAYAGLQLQSRQFDLLNFRFWPVGDFAPGSSAPKVAPRGHKRAREQESKRADRHN